MSAALVLSTLVLEITATTDSAIITSSLDVGLLIQLVLGFVVAGKLFFWVAAPRSVKVLPLAKPLYSAEEPDASSPDDATPLGTEKDHALSPSSRGSPRRIAVVTGGSGFLGSYLIGALISQAKYQEIISIDLAPPAHPPTTSSDDDVIVTHVTIDLCQADQGQRYHDDLLNSLRGAEVVFHTCGLVRLDYDIAPMFNVNVVGTQSVLNAAHAMGVSRLVMASSVQVLNDGSMNCHLTHEDEEYPEHFALPYAETKARAERLVRQAGRASRTLDTVSLRFPLIYGIGDRFCIDQISRGNMRVSIKSGPRNHVYVKNAVYAHLLADEALEERPLRVNGNAYFCHDENPLCEREFVVPYVVGVGGRPPDELPDGVAKALAMLSEGLFWYHGGYFRKHMFWQFTRLTLLEAQKAITSTTQRARDDLAYVPPYSTKTAREDILSELAQGVDG